MELVVIVDDVLTVRPLPEHGPLSLGRDKTCDVRIDTVSVSRRHARLHLHPRLSIEDLGSRNGTFVTEKAALSDATEPIRRLLAGQMPLSIGERVSLGTGAIIVVRRTAIVSLDAAAEDRAVVLDPVMRMLHAQLQQAARGQITILLLGETGVGKEVFAREVHAASRRARGPFVALDCSSLPAALAEDHLHGHERGAYTNADRGKPGYFEAAHKGTLFLDEVGELSPELQIKFLRLLEERAITPLGHEGQKPRPVDVRIVAATNRDLREEVARGTFRLDLLHRLNSLEIEIPPLRQRPSEIAALAERFILRFSRMLDRDPPTLAPETLLLLRAFAWPGNVRELRNVIERAVTLCQGPRILPEDLPQRISLARPDRNLLHPEPPGPAIRHPLARGLGGPERDQIIAALQECGGNQTRAAGLLEISRRTLVNRLNAIVDLPRPRKPRGPARN